MLSPSRLLPRGHHHLRKRFFTVLALESSADDTCAAVITSSGQILSNIVVKQNHMYVRATSLYPVRSNTAIDMKAMGAFIPTGLFKPINKTWWVLSRAFNGSLIRQTAWCCPESTERRQYRRRAGRRYRLYAWAR